MIDDTVLTRRSLIAKAAFLGAAVTVGGVVAAASPTPAVGAEKPGDVAFIDVQYGFLVDISKCVGCNNCVDACRKYNRLSDDTPDRRVVTEYRDGREQRVWVSTSCMHCADPSCVRVCPAHAITKGAAGIVSVDKNLCIGCKYCYHACPYEVPSYNSEGMDKCDCCLSCGVAPGDTPHCVDACLFGALAWGPIDELMQAQPDGTEPRPVAEANDPSCYLV